MKFFPVVLLGTVLVAIAFIQPAAAEVSVEYAELCRKSAELAETMSNLRQKSGKSEDEIKRDVIKGSKKIDPTIAYALRNVGHNFPEAYVYTFQSCIADAGKFTQ